MSIYQIQEQLRGLPDDQLLREMQQPSGAAPQYLILTEIERRQQLRRGAQAKPPGQTVAQELAQGLAGIPSLPQGAPMPGGQMPAGVPAQMPAQMPAGADAGIAAMQQPQGFAEGGEVDPGIAELKRAMNEIQKKIFIGRAQKKYDDESGGVEDVIDWGRGDEMSGYPEKEPGRKPFHPLLPVGGSRLPSGKYRSFFNDGGNLSLDDLTYMALSERNALQKSQSERKGDVSLKSLRELQELLFADEEYRRLAALRDLAHDGYEVDVPMIFGSKVSSIRRNNPKGPGYASGGEVEEEGSDLFSDGLFGSILPAKGLIDWATERWDQKGPFGFGLISLLQDGFKNDPKKKAMMESEEVTPETSINSNMTPMARTYSSGGEVEDDDDGGFNPMGMLGGVLPMIADGFTDGNKYGSGVLGLLLNKRKPWESGGKSEGDMSPEDDQSMNSNMTPIGFAGGDYVLSPTSKLREMIYGIESRGGKDLNSVASGGKYIGPGQMNADSYADAVRYAKKMNPNMSFPTWNNSWVGSPEGNRPKGYPTKPQWDALADGYIEFSKDMLRRNGIPVNDATVYGAYNLGSGNINKLYKNKDKSMGEVLASKVVSQNKFDPSATWGGVVDELGRRVGAQRVGAQPGIADRLYDMIPNREDITSVLARFSPPQASPPPVAAPTLTSSRFVPLPASTATRDPAQRAMVQGPGAQSTLSKTSLRREEAADQEKQNASEFENLLNKLTATNKAQQAAPMPQQGQGMMQRPQQDSEDEIGALINRLERKRNMAQDKRKKRLGYAEGGIIGYAEGDEVDATESYPDYVLEKLRAAGRTKLDPLGDMVQKPPHLMNDMEKFISGTEREGDYAPPDASGKPVSPSTQSILPSKYFSPPKVPDMTSPRFRPIKGLYGDMMGDPVYGPNTFSGVPILPGADGTTSKERSLSDIYAELDALGKGGEMSPELKDLFNQLKRDKNQEMWLSLAQFGANLAAGQSPYFAENLGNATKAGIQTLIEGDRAAKSDIGAMINATLMDQQNRDVNRRSLIGNTSEIYRSDQEYRRAIETAKIALQKAQETAKKSPGYRESVSIEFEQKVSEAAATLMQNDPTKKMTREEARAQVLKDMVQSSNVARTAGIGITSIRSEEDTGPVALDLVGGQ